MPYRKKKKKSFFKKRKKGGKKRYKKRTYGKKKRYKNQRVMLFRGMSFLPQKYNCCHTYHEFATFETSTGFIDFAYELIDLVNPGSSSPARGVDGFFTMEAIYNQWRVTSVDWSLQSTNFSDVPHQLIVLPRQDNTAFVADELMAQQPYSKTRMVGSHDGSYSTVFLRGHVDISKLAGRKVVFDDEGLTSGIGSASPTSPMSLNILWSNLGAAPVDEIGVVFHIRLSYNVTWWDRDIIPTSPHS